MWRPTKEGKNRIVIETTDLKESCLEYSLQGPKLWIETEHALYCLPSPAKKYPEKHELARKRFEVCARANILPVQFEPLQYSDALAFLGCPYGRMKKNTGRHSEYPGLGFIMKQVNIGYSCTRNLY